jgi:hypothetical protein
MLFLFSDFCSKKDFTTVNVECSRYCIATVPAVYTRDFIHTRAHTHARGRKQARTHIHTLHLRLKAIFYSLCNTLMLYFVYTYYLTGKLPSEILRNAYRKEKNFLFVSLYVQIPTLNFLTEGEKA